MSLNVFERIIINTSAERKMSAGALISRATWIEEGGARTDFLSRETNQTAVCNGTNCESSVIPLNNSIVVPPVTVNDRAESLVHYIIHIVQELGRRRKVFDLRRHEFESFALEIVFNECNDVSNGSVSARELGEGFIGLIERVLCRLVDKGLGVGEDSAQLHELEKFGPTVPANFSSSCN
jgi:hypothetical protein